MYEMYVLNYVNYNMERSQQDSIARNAGIIVGSGVGIVGITTHIVIDSIKYIVTGKIPASFCDWLLRCTYWLAGSVAIGAVTQLLLSHKDTQRVQISRGESAIRDMPSRQTHGIQMYPIHTTELRTGYNPVKHRWEYRTVFH